jgi:hypothetical protein
MLNFEWESIRSQKSKQHAYTQNCMMAKTGVRLAELEKRAQSDFLVSHMQMNAVKIHTELNQRDTILN